ncbi:MAG: hypothetical protein AAFV46_02785, partial [Cyanobacteria bacterium J06635_11]
MAIGSLPEHDFQSLGCHRLGLIGLQERLSLVGGTLEIESHARAMTQAPPVKTPARTVLTIRIPHAQHSTA